MCVLIYYIHYFYALNVGTNAGMQLYDDKIIISYNFQIIVKILMFDHNDNCWDFDPDLVDSHSNYK